MKKPNFIAIMIVVGTLLLITTNIVVLYFIFTADKRVSNIVENTMQQVYEVPECPIIINSIKVGNVDYYGNIETNFGGTIYSSKSMYLSPQIEYKSVASKEGMEVELYVKFFKDGELMQSSRSPFGYTYLYWFKIKTEDKLVLDGWGGIDAGYWSSGNYRFEIWCNNSLLKSVDFKVY